MEFDLEAFTADVEAALRYQSPILQIGTAKTREGGDDNDHEERRQKDRGQKDDRDISGRYKRRRLDTSGERGRNSSVLSGNETGPIITLDSKTRNQSVDIDISNDDSDSEEDGVSLFLHPDMDMSTAISSTFAHPPHQPKFQLSSLISSEPLSSVPNFYAYIVKATLLPIRKVQSELVTLYFQHVHPMFPIVDEYRVSELHRKYRGGEELMDPDEFAVYHGVMVAGFAHLSEAQVRLTPYRSVLEGQEAQVDQLKARYWSQLTTNQVVLTQICLILSLWSPGWIGSQNNSYWLDMAFKHATYEKLWEYEHPPNDTKYTRNRHKLLWWCCLIRDRVLALGMRRPHRLHKATISTSSYQEQLITEDDFGLEAKFPSYLDRESKHVSMLSFIWFCKLSKIMARIAVAKGRQKFERDWNGGEDEEGVEEGLRKLDGFERELRGWVEGFEGVVEEVLGLSKSSEVVGGGDGGVPVAVSTLRIMVHSLRASLYQPYLHLPPDHPALVEAGIDPLQRMKDGAREVAITCREVMGSKKCDAIPTWLVSWVTLPVAVYHVNQLIRQNSTPDQVLMPFLAQLVRRTSGALMLLRTVRAATRDHIERITEAENAGDNATLTDGGQKRADTVRLKFVYEGFDRAGENRIAEAKLLACVTKVVDEALELNGSRQEA